MRWTNAETCGCKSTERTIEYCSLHALAPEMAEALRAVAGLYAPDDNNPHDPSRGLAKIARALLARLA